MIGRSFLVFVYIFPAFLQENPNNRAIVKQIERLGGLVQRDRHGKLSGVVLFDNSLLSSERPNFIDEDIEKLDLRSFSHIMITSKVVSDTTLIHLGKFPKLTSLSLFYTKISDKGLTHFLKKQESLFYLALYHTKTTDLSLEAIANLPELSFLTLAKVNITDKGLEKLKNLKQLESLTLSETKISDAGLVHLNYLNNLRLIDLSRTGITDAGIMKLKDLKMLNILYIRSTKVTKKGEDDLRKHLPGLKIDKEEIRTKYDFFWETGK